MKSENISFTESEEAGTVIYVAADGKYIGNMPLSPVNEGSKARATKPRDANSWA